MAQTTVTYANASGATVTLEATTGGVATIPNNRICDAAAHFLPPGDAVGRAIYVLPTDGTNSAKISEPNAALAENAATWLQTAALALAIDPNAAAGSQAVTLTVLSTAVPLLKVGVFGSNGSTQMPAMAAAGSKGFQAITDGTNTATCKAASTAAAAADTALVVAVSPNNSPFAAMTSGVGTVSPNSSRTGAQYLAFGSLPAATTAQQVALQCDVAGTLRSARSRRVFPSTTAPGTRVEQPRPWPPSRRPLERWSTSPGLTLMAWEPRPALLSPSPWPAFSAVP